MVRIVIEGKVYRYDNREVAKRLGVHYNTITNVLNQGESHPKYGRLIKVIKESTSK